MSNGETALWTAFFICTAFQSIVRGFEIWKLKKRIEDLENVIFSSVEDTCSEAEKFHDELDEDEPVIEVAFRTDKVE